MSDTVNDVKNGFELSENDREIMQERNSFSAGFMLLFKRKELFPTAIYFILITIFFTALKIGILSQSTVRTVLNSDVFRAIVIGIDFYLLFYSFISVFPLMEYLIYTPGHFFTSFVKSLFWLAIFIFLAATFSDISEKLASALLFPGALLWIMLGAITLNSSIMNSVKLSSGEKFSFVKFLSGLLIIGITLFTVRSVAEFFPEFGYWYIMGGIFVFLAVIFPKKTLATALYYLSIFLYFMMFVLYYVYSISSDGGTSIPASAIPADLKNFVRFIAPLLIIVMLGIYYSIFLYTMGNIGKTLIKDVRYTEASPSTGNISVTSGGNTDGKNKEPFIKRLRFNFFALITLWSAFSFVIYEYILQRTDPTAPIFILQLRYYGVILTAIFVYLYKIIKGFRAARKNR